MLALPASAQEEVLFRLHRTDEAGAMSLNPYQSPPEAAPVTSAGGNAAPAPTYELYSPQQIGVAAFLGAPIAACWFIARNFRNLGNHQAETLWLIGGLIGTVAVLVVSFFLPAGFPNQLIPLGYLFGLLYATKRVQGEAINRHIAAGGQLGSWWKVVGVGLLCLAVILGIIFAIVFAFMPAE
jgi:hypothetical protein